MSGDFAGMRVVVTGGAGLIGRASVSLLAARGAHVTSFDRNPGDAACGVGRAAGDRAVGDISDFAAVRAAVAGADAVVHLAGIPGPDLADHVETYRVNTVGTYSVFAAAAEAGVGKVVYASSINASGLPIGKRHPPSLLPYDEDEPAAIYDSYSLSKEANERAAVMAAARWGLALTGLRFPLVRDITVNQGLHFSGHVRDALRRDPLRQAYEGWSYLHVVDAAEVIANALTRNTPPAPGILVAAPLTYLVEDTADAARLVMPDVPIVGLEGRSVGLDLTRCQSLLDFQARTLLEDVAPGLLVSVKG